MSIWSALDARRRIIVGLATVAVFAAVLMLARGAGSRDMALLYSGLDPAAAGEVVTALDQQGAAFEVRGTAIYVEAARRDELRMTLAGQGLPASSAQGYELLDSMSGFGTTSQMFDAAYWRAKEGELARTILASPYIRAARVHISTPTNRPFARSEKATAAVTVTTSGGALSAAHARALRYLVAAAVSGLAPEDVAVIDSQNGLISGDDVAAMGGADRAEELRNRAERLLEARVGYGNAVVEVSVDTVTESEQITERTIQPDSRTAISTETQESSNTAQDTRGNNVTVASNLPAGAGANGGANGNSKSDSSETRSTTNYDVSETRREVTRAPGAVRRLSVAVLVNEVSTTDANGVVTSTPRSPAELDALKALVASAVGLDEARGDIITLESLPFEPIPVQGTEAVATGTPLNIMSLIQIGVLALVSLILGLFVVRPILLGRATAQPLSLPEPDDIFADAGLPQGFPIAFGGDDDDDGMIDGELIGGGDADPVQRLRQLIEDRQSETLQILQNWIEEPEEVEQAG